MANPGKALESFEAILSVQAFTLEQGHVDKFAARRIGQFLIGKAIENVSGRSWVFWKEESLFWHFFLGRARGRRHEQHGRHDYDMRVQKPNIHFQNTIGSRIPQSKFRAKMRKPHLEAVQIG